MSRLSTLLGIAVLGFSLVSTPVPASELYFGQEPPSDEPVVFAPGIVSQEGRYEQFLLYSPDERELVFGVTNSNWSLFTLKHMVLHDGGWTEATRAPFIGQTGDALTACYSHDMQRAYFTSSRPVYPPANIWVSERTADGWSEPTLMGAPVSSNRDEFEVSISRNGTLYFSSNRGGGEGDLDIYRARLTDGGYPAAENLGPPVNTGSGDDIAFIAPDESYMVFGSNRPGGYGQRDLYVTFQVDGTWTDPVNLGPRINTEAYDIYPTVSPDGRYLFFSRRVNWITQSDSDIYWVSTEVIHRLRPTRHVVAASGNGVDTVWSAEMAVVNISGEESLTLDMELLPEHSSLDPCERKDVPSTPCPPVTRFEVGPFQELWLDNLLEQAFNYTGTAAVAVSVAAGQPSNLRLMTRVISSNGIPGAPTQGQVFDSAVDDRAATPGEPATLVLLADRHDVRINIGLVNIGEAVATTRVSLLATGTYPPGQLNATLDPGGFRQFNDVLAATGTSDGAHALARVEVLSDRGRVLAYASVIDNQSGDPTTILPSAPHTGTLLVPAVARSAGARQGLEWRTTLSIGSFDEDDAEVVVQLLPAARDNSDPQSVPLTLAPGEHRVFSDVVAELFSAEDITAALRLESTGAIAVMTRTYSLPTGEPEGPTRGQGIPAVPPGETFGERSTATIPGLESSADPAAGYRTNLGLVNASMTDPVDLEIALWGNGVVLLGTLNLRLPPGGFELLSEVYRSVTDETVTRGFAIVSTPTSGGRFYAFGSKVDNQSGDGTYIPGR